MRCIDMQTHEQSIPHVSFNDPDYAVQNWLICGCSRIALLSACYLCIRVVGSEAQRHALTKVNGPTSADVYILCPVVHKGQTSTSRIEVSASQCLQDKY